MNYTPTPPGETSSPTSPNQGEVSSANESSGLFYHLVLSFQAAALQQFGQIPNPITGKTERNLEQARLSIDMLGMLTEKTKGNLTEDESKLLDTVLYQLRIQFLEETKKGEKKSAEAPPQSPP